MPDLQDFIKIWFSNSPHIKLWLLDTTHFIAKAPRAQKGWIYIAHDCIEFHVYGQYRSNTSPIPQDDTIKAADPEFFDKLDVVLKNMIL